MKKFFTNSIEYYIMKMINQNQMWTNNLLRGVRPESVRHRHRVLTSHRSGGVDKIVFFWQQQMRDETGLVFDNLNKKTELLKA